MFDIKGTLFFGKTFIDLPYINSTNAYAAELLTKSKVLSGTIVSTFHQTAGKGAHTNQWLSAPYQNLSFSVIVFPTFLKPIHQFKLNMAFCLGITDFLDKNFDETFKIKWPNDIYYQNKKMGGLLIENSIQGDRIQSSVIGMGLNVNQSKFDESLPNPVSLKMITGDTFDLYKLLQGLIPIIEKRYMQLQNRSFQILKDDYLQRLYRINEPALYHFNGQTKEGKITDVDAYGKLLIDFGGEVIAFGFKEVIFE